MMTATRMLAAVLFCATPGCVGGDIQATVTGSAGTRLDCEYQLYSEGKEVENSPIRGRFEEIYAVSPVLAPKEVRIVCGGKVVATREVRGSVDFGTIAP